MVTGCNPRPRNPTSSTGLEDIDRERPEVARITAEAGEKNYRVPAAAPEATSTPRLLSNELVGVGSPPMRVESQVKARVEDTAMGRTLVGTKEWEETAEDLGELTKAMESLLPLELCRRSQPGGTSEDFSLGKTSVRACN